ncbi:MAG: DnaJ C-terminal domain-containing protein [Psychrobacter celer]|uniref:DnaJ C-terminal domain-containing protein n=1 Tax=uncultured Psychrobacter sp. TaxID=259303 RepID=UPI0025947AD7|nr:DnaJ C-terminal domain-containing protein [uncultured Psychrobacter sp.]
MAEKNYYDILGVKKDASDADIKKKYRKLVRQYHPDVSDDPNADNKIAEINNAYETLRDKDKRAQYDAMLDNPFAGQGGAGGFGGFGGQSAGGQGGFRWEDIKDQFGDGQAFGDGGFRFDDIFSAFGRGARGSAGGQAGGRTQGSGFEQFGGGFGAQDNKGQDQHAEIAVDLASVYSGDDYSIKLNVPVRQPDGSVDYENKTLKIKIPKGITDGKQIRLAGQGSAGIGGGKNGDLFLKVKIRHDPNIRIEGADVYQTVNIAPWEAALGGKINVSTPAGTLGVTIPKNSKSGSNLRLKGKGIPAKQAGDLYLTLNIVNPDITDSNREAVTKAYEQLKQAFGDTSINR